MNILDPRFKYTPSAQTDIRKTIRREQRRILREQLRQSEIDEQNLQEAVRKVAPITGRKS